MMNAILKRRASNGFVAMREIDPCNIRCPGTPGRPGFVCEFVGAAETLRFTAASADEVPWDLHVADLVVVTGSERPAVSEPHRKCSDPRDRCPGRLVWAQDRV